MDNIQKYVYMICFTGYIREQAKAAVAAGGDEFKLAGGKSTKAIYSTKFLHHTFLYLVCSVSKKYVIRPLFFHATYLLALIVMLGWYYMLCF